MSVPSRPSRTLSRAERGRILRKVLGAVLAAAAVAVGVAFAVLAPPTEPGLRVFGVAAAVLALLAAALTVVTAVGPRRLADRTAPRRANRVLGWAVALATAAGVVAMAVAGGQFLLIFAMACILVLIGLLAGLMCNANRIDIDARGS